MATRRQTAYPDWMPNEAVRAWCERWRVAELWLFGSALDHGPAPGSDIDLLYVHEDGANWSLFDHMEMREELEELLGRPIDLVSKRAIADSRNPFRREAILGTARQLDVA